MAFLFLWYCKKFKINKPNMTIEHVKDLFQKYSRYYSDGRGIYKIDRTVFL